MATRRLPYKYTTARHKPHGFALDLKIEFPCCRIRSQIPRRRGYRRIRQNIISSICQDQHFNNMINEFGT
jgi:hypothetical protein